MTRLEELKNEFEWLIEFKKLGIAAVTDPSTMQKHVRMIRDRIASLSRHFEDPLAQPITEEWRHRISEDGESGVDYVIYEDCGESDDEIQEYVDEEIGYAPICSPYDCTGRRFTWDKHWKRTPVGIVIIHRWGLDV